MASKDKKEHSPYRAKYDNDNLFKAKTTRKPRWAPRPSSIGHSELINVNARSLMLGKHKYRVEIRVLGEVTNSLEETFDLEEALSFCRVYFNHEDKCAVLFFVDNKRVRYSSYVELMKYYFNYTSPLHRTMILPS